MIIDWASFTPGNALVGGILIGIATGTLVLFNGRIAGISGIVGGLLAWKPGEVIWRVAFLVGIILAPILYSSFISLPKISIDATYPMLALSGFLVGIGTRYGGGCTSGHGVCGLSRLSLRSLTATLSFMAAGFLTVFLIRHVITV